MTDEKQALLDLAALLPAELRDAALAEFDAAELRDAALAARTAETLNRPENYFSRRYMAECRH